MYMNKMPVCTAQAGINSWTSLVMAELPADPRMAGQDHGQSESYSPTFAYTLDVNVGWTLLALSLLTVYLVSY